MRATNFHILNQCDMKFIFNISCELRTRSLIMRENSPPSSLLPPFKSRPDFGGKTPQVGILRKVAVGPAINRGTEDL